MLVKDDYKEALKIFLEEMEITSEDPEQQMKEIIESSSEKIMSALKKQHEVKCQMKIETF